jgi:hypothetical protein
MSTEQPENEQPENEQPENEQLVAELGSALDAADPMPAELPDIVRALYDLEDL